MLGFASAPVRRGARHNVAAESARVQFSGSFLKAGSSAATPTSLRDASNLGPRSACGFSDGASSMTGPQSRTASLSSRSRTAVPLLGSLSSRGASDGLTTCPATQLLPEMSEQDLNDLLASAEAQGFKRTARRRQEQRPQATGRPFHGEDGRDEGEFVERKVAKPQPDSSTIEALRDATPLGQLQRCGECGDVPSSRPMLVAARAPCKCCPGFRKGVDELERLKAAHELRPLIRPRASRLYN